MNCFDAEKRAGYPGVLQPAVDFAVALGKARADAIWKGYEFDREEIDEEIILGIVVDAGSILEQCLSGLIAGEKGRMALVAHRTSNIDPGANAKISELTRHVTKTICDAKEDIRNELMLRMFEAKRSADGGRATKKVSELARRVQKFRDDLAAHFELWGQSLDSTLPEYPERNISEITRQMSGLARQLGSLRPYLGRLGLSTTMGNAYSQWDAYDSAVSNDIAIRKGSSINAILPQLEQALGRLELNDPDAEFEGEKGRPTGSAPQQVTNIYNLHGAHSRVNLQSTDQSVNVSSITEQQVFSGFRAAVAEGVPDGSEKTDILEKLDALERSVHNRDFLSKYQAFMNAVASHITIILPFIPALTQMLGN